MPEMPDVVRQHRQRLVDGAHRYSAADRSDPFALSRALAHIRVGIADGKALDNHHQIAVYDATPQTETRHLPPGHSFSNGDTSWQMTVYKNICRP